MALRFNIIYTPGTVRSLRIFVLSLLHHTDCAFRLVTNGCDDAEVATIERFCSISKRLEFYRFVEKRRAPNKISQHGTVLNHLVELETSSHFCFMDSDIFALGDFMVELRPLLGHYAAVFSCPPVWVTTSDRIASCRSHVFGGPHYATESGIVLGGSYFAVYAIGPLRTVMAETGVTFQKYARPGIVRPPRLTARIKERMAFVRSPLRREQAAIAELGVSADLYDTGKLVNLLLQASGHRLTGVDLPFLRHVGGLSIEARQRLASSRSPGASQNPALRPADPHRPWVRRNDETCRYLSNLLLALTEGVAVDDDLHIDDVEVHRRVLELADQMRGIFAQFRHLLPD